MTARVILIRTFDRVMKCKTIVCANLWLHEFRSNARKGRTKVHNISVALSARRAGGRERKETRMAAKDYLDPEARARMEIDRRLAAAGWALQDDRNVNVGDGRGRTAFPSRSL